MASPESTTTPVATTITATAITTATTTTATETKHQLPASVLFVYPATLLLGSLFSILSPTAQVSRVRTEHFTHSLTADVNLQENSLAAASYFARKNNVFNIYFVKIGWLWTTLAFLSLLSQLRFWSKSLATQRSRQVSQALARYVLATLSWYLTTQWFFGPGIIDRSFVITGGRCENGLYAHVSYGHKDVEDEGKRLEKLLTGATCKAAGGHWRGGHDVSGHVFMLVLATALLVFEDVGISKLVQRSEDRRADSIVPATIGRGIWARRTAWTVAGLGWWMLFMTAIWFHTWLEKWSGLLLALGAIYVIYILPRRVPTWESVVGLPGV